MIGNRPKRREPSAYAIETYKEASQHARTMFEQFFRLCALTFTLNSVLFTGFAILANSYLERAKVKEAGLENIYNGAFVAATAIGFAYNIGALTVYLILLRNWYGVSGEVRRFEARMAWTGAMQSTKHLSPTKGIAYFGPLQLTVYFFLAILIATWSVALYWAIYRVCPWLG